MVNENAKFLEGFNVITSKFSQMLHESITKHFNNYGFDSAFFNVKFTVSIEVDGIDVTKFTVERTWNKMD